MRRDIPGGIAQPGGIGVIVHQGRVSFGTRRDRQPRDSIGLLAQVRRWVPVPILADEAIFMPGHLDETLDLDAFDILSNYPGKNGGFSHSLAMARKAKAAGKACAIGSNLETDLGQAATACLASSLSAFPADRLACDLIGGAVLRDFQRDPADRLSRRSGESPDRARIRSRAIETTGGRAKVGPERYEVRGWVN
jgi:hypothetical protein